MSDFLLKAGFTPRVRLAAALGLLVVIGFLEAQHPFTSCRLLTFILAFFAFACAASALRGAIQNGFVLFSALSLGLSLAEGVATIADSRVLAVLADGFSVPQPVIGLGPQHAGRFHAEKREGPSHPLIYSADYTIDDNLLRQTLSASSGPTIAFFGDSFTFGEGLGDSDALPQLFADLLNRKLRVLNFAYPGYGPQHFLAALESGRFDSVIGAKPRLFIFMTGAGHAERAACKPFWVRRWPRYVLENGQVILKGACSEGLREKIWAWLEDSAAYRLFVEPYFLRVTREDLRLYVEIIVKAIKLANEKYGVVTLIPYTFNPRLLKGTGMTDGEIVHRFEAAGGMVVDVDLGEDKPEGTALSIKGDGHPTALANHFKAAIIKDYLASHAPSVLALP